MRESSQNKQIPIESARVDRVDMLDKDAVLAMFSNGKTVVIEVEKFKQFALRSGRIVDSD